MAAGKGVVAHDSVVHSLLQRAERHNYQFLTRACVPRGFFNSSSLNSIVFSPVNTGDSVCTHNLHLCSIAPKGVTNALEALK